MSEPPVVISGGGIAGLAIAIAVARGGRAVRLFERADAPSAEGAGIQLSPNATRHLQTWGVLERLSAQALTPEATCVRRGSDGAILARLGFGDAIARWGAPFRIAHRADLHQAFLEVVRNDPRITLVHGCAIVGWRDETILSIETTSGSLEAAALIIADGVGSALREQFEPGAKLGPSGRVAWRALVPSGSCPPFARQPVTNLWLGANAHLVHYPLRAGSVVNVVAVVHDATATPDRTKIATSAPAAFARWCRDVRELTASAEEWRPWPLLMRPLPRALAYGRVAVAGDAAHPMLPFLAQGGAQAIEDAAALGDLLTDTADVPRALQRYSHMRYARVKRVVSASERQGRIYHLSGAMAHARDTAMRVGGETALRVATDWLYRA